MGKAKGTRTAKRGSALRAPRSAKAGRPPRTSVAPPRVRRRRRRASVTLKKGAVLLQAERPPRTAWGAESPRVKKR
ncbi:MAG: hypothetical protein A3E31_01675 [Candidatus Rokubacteria bacterium RIFCSPHIGHO2_12_FULL_73_22]|nr:MAG: hypothetical protein A3D33_18595 [Candidatus Rokubacteria bacterium RIFCSPHIGHO2_02_FULL_73_26]OGL04443.1 MAG: hypothetical protein A3E31_01675 [Candidatus Rokubacteria bacterium RIFCSPHIGHO2_12_FULL_73_22]OGL09842.1 MAG: hypothetical protein A3I14_19620 [Candidatus Rokubacteria bacterium RIFCSPLOWO2_02_FULL_73_56]OGL26761.1 MAG: hypothetical protein A3G44_08950 [Candidatus Rokubacteria bacterium RIFCSPLOWO2_12_FULL_73_47]